MLLAKVPKRTTKLEHTQKLMAFEEAARAEGADVDCSTWHTHHHCDGTYVREFRLPADHAVTGQVHRYPCINIIAKGRVRVTQHDGTKDYEAGDLYISEAGEKKALYAYEDTVFMTIHATEETDPDKIWEHFTVPHEQALEYQAKLQIEVK